jgi:hypothetical protein
MPSAKRAVVADLPSNACDTNEPLIELSVWQRPLVQRIVPFVTSLAIHAGMVLIGVVFFVGANYVSTKSVRQEQFTIPSTGLMTGLPMPGMQERGPNAGLDRLARQDVDEQATPAGISDRKSSSLRMNASAGSGDPSDAIIGVGIGGRIGAGHGPGNSSGNGNGDGGALLPFGAPGGHGMGAGPIFIDGGGARRIVFICDASGSMLVKFDTLRRELGNTVARLRPVQSFNIVFFQEHDALAFDRGGLVMATPETKLRVANFLADGVVARGETFPIPAIELAFRQKPDLIYLLTDGDFPDNAVVLAKIRALNATSKVKVNTIAFISEADTDTAFMSLLQTIARENGGIYRCVKSSDL